MLFPDEFVSAIEAIAVGGGLPEGIGKLASGIYTPTSSVSNFSVTHNLGVIPMFAAAFALDEEGLTYSSSAAPVIAWVGRTEDSGGAGCDVAFVYKSSASAVSGNGTSAATSSYPITTTKYAFATRYSSRVFQKGQGYFWILGTADGMA